MYKIDKDQLLKESQELGFEEVGFDSIMESLELDDETKGNLVEALKLASRTGAVELVEQHMAKLVDVAETKLAEQVESIQSDFDSRLDESVDELLVAVGEQWLEENKLAVQNATEAKLFKNLLEGLKTVLIDNNVSIPEDKIDLFEELVLEEQETREMANTIHKENRMLKEELNIIKRDQLIESVSVGMTESQKETFVDLAHAIKLDESYGDRIQKLSESLIIGKKEPSAKDTALVESLKQGSTKKTEAEVQPLNESKKGQVETPKQVESIEQLRERNLRNRI